MQRVPAFSTCAFLALAAASFLAAQVPSAGTPSFRLTPEQVAQAAQRIDAAIIAQDRARWDREMQRTDPARRTPFEVPPDVDDATFIRRVTLDLHSRNPETLRTRAFLADSGPAKRSNEIDRLLLDPASGARRFTRLADMLRVKDSVLGVSLRPYAAWLQDACANAVPYDQMVRDLITASGEVDTNPSTGWFLGDAGHCTTTVSEALRIFLDEDFNCARCHDHPFSKWTQKQFYEFAACLGGAQVLRSGPQGMTRLWPAEPLHEAEETPMAAGERLLIADVAKAVPVVLPRNYAYRDGKPGDEASPTVWQWKSDEVSGFKSLRKVRGDQLRGEFAIWLTGNQRFAEVAALRTWIGLFGWAGSGDNEGLGIVEVKESTDALAIHPGSCSRAGARNLPYWMTGQFIDAHTLSPDRSFLRTIGRELAAVKYDLREFERILCHTAAYQRKSITLGLGMPLRPAAPLARRLPAETVWNNLVLVQSDGEIPGAAPLSHELAQVPDEEHPSRILGRGAREWGDDSLPLITHRIVRLMMNGDTVKLASDADSPLVRRLRQAPSAEVGVDEAFLTVLSRFPSHQEKLNALDHGIAHPATMWSDLVWSLLNTSEFLFQR